MFDKTYTIVEDTSENGSNPVEEFGSMEEAKEALKEMKNSDVDPYYEDLVAAGGNLWIDC